MLCVKCKKDIPDGAPFCCWCGRKQTAEQKRTRRRAHGMGTNGRYVGAFKTRREAEQALEAYLNEKRPDLYNVTLDRIYKMWSDKHFETLSASGVQGYTVITQYVQIVLCVSSIFVYVYKLF